MSRPWLLGLAVLLGCGGGSTAVRPRGAAWIAKIKIDGNRAVDDDAIIPHLALDRTRKGGRGVDMYQLKLDTERVRQAYVRKGYFAATVTEHVDVETGPQTVTFKVQEGPRAKTRVSITGLPAHVSLSEARAIVKLEDGGDFDYETYDLAKEELAKLVESAGYPYVDLDPSVTVDNNIAIARYDFTAGPRCTFGEITITGATGDLLTAIERRLEFATGDVFSTKAIEATQQSIYELGRFATVLLEPDLQNEARVIPIRVTVTPGARGELRIGLGGGYDTAEPEARIRLGFSHIPRALPLWTLGFDLRAALVFPYFDFASPEPRVRALATARRLDFLMPRLIGDIGLGYEFLALEAYTVQGPLGQVGVSFPLLARWLQVRVGWAASYQIFTDVTPILNTAGKAFYGLDQSEWLASYQQSLVADLRDNATNTRSGAYLSLRVAEGTQYAGGAYDYVQVTPEVRFFVPFRRSVFAVHGRAGRIWGDVPVTERYFAGGPTSHRGFAYRQLAPRVYGEVDGKRTSEPIGGAASLETNFEIRTELGEIFKDTPFVLSVFLDGGNVVPEVGQLFERSLYWAAGVGGGLILFDEVKVRFDIARRLNRTGPGNLTDDEWPENWEYFLAIGDAF